jgi:colicin import membrane protein
LPILAQKLSRIGDWGGSNLDANSLQSGSVLDAIQQSSGLKAWDDAVLRAIDRTAVLPKDIDGHVPPKIIFGFRPYD